MPIYISRPDLPPSPRFDNGKFPLGFVVYIVAAFNVGFNLLWEMKRANGSESSLVISGAFGARPAKLLPSSRTALPGFFNFDYQQVPVMIPPVDLLTAIWSPQASPSKRRPSWSRWHAELLKEDDSIAQY